MIVTNSAISKACTPLDKKLFVEVIRLGNVVHDFTKSLPNSEIKALPSFECHSICRAVASKVTKLKVVDGEYVGVRQRRNRKKRTCTLYLRYAAHSWLVTPSGAIIDPYPIGFLTPNAVLVVGKGTYKPFGVGLYVADKSVTRHFRKLKIAQKSRILARLMRRALQASTLNG